MCGKICVNVRVWGIDTYSRTTQNEVGQGKRIIFIDSPSVSSGLNSILHNLLPEQLDEIYTHLVSSMDLLVWPQTQLQCSTVLKIFI